MPPTSPLPTAPGLLSSDYLEGPDTVYDIQEEFTGNEGVLLMPVAGPPGTPASIIQASAPYGYRIVRWVAERLGARVIVPSRRPRENEVLHSWRIVPKNPVLTDDLRTYIYRTEGEYCFALLSPPSEQDALPMGAPPTYTTQLAENSIQPSDYRQGII
jgi:hypothetical protein